MRDKLQKFLIGRNGMDQLSRALLWGVLIVMVFSWIVPKGQASAILYGVALCLVVLTYFRVLSRKLDKRRAENNRYMELTGVLRSGGAAKLRRLQQKKEYKFYKCPSCGMILRVPRGKGQIMITCRQCGTKFKKKT